MRIWLVERTDAVDYDEFDAFVVRASDEAEAVRVVWDEYGGGTITLLGARTLERLAANVTVTPVPDAGKAGIILDSFCAG